MRILTFEKIQEVTEKSNSIVNEVVNLYNSKPQNSKRLAIKGGTRRPRCKDEEKALSRFTLK